MMRALSRRLATAALALALAVATASAVAAPPVTGGVSEEERDALLELAAPYNLLLVFAEEGTGHYLANVDVTVEDTDHRPVVDVVTAGPWVLAQVPPGFYLVRAGDIQRRIVVDANRTVAVVRLPGSPTYAIVPGEGLAPTLSRPRDRAPQIGG